MKTRIVTAAGFILIGAAAYAGLQALWSGRPAAEVPVAAPPAAAPAMSVESAGPAIVSLSTEAVARAGIRAMPVEPAGAAAVRSVPGTVEPNAYRQVDITTLLGGTVIDVPVILGETVEAGQVVARLRSPELTDEVRAWRTVRADRDVTASRLARAQRLAAIGAASQQDLEQARADDVRAATEVETRLARLMRFGLSEAQLATMAAGDALPDQFTVRASAPGVVITRQANPGLNVEAGAPIVTVADLRVVWVMADVFEADLASLRIGQSAEVRAAAFAGRRWTGRVTYIEPALARETRTARVRVEVANDDRQLRFGMLTTVHLAGRADDGARPGVTVAAAAIQQIGAVAVVYVEQAAGRYEERVVTLGASEAGLTRVTTGLAAGERVVVEGAFALRAERDRLGLPAPASAVERRDEGADRPAATTVAARVVEITAAGLVPARVSVPAGQPVDIVFVRRVEETCGTELAIPDLGIRRDLPLGQRVTVRLPPQPPGELAFSCGMDMLKGVIVVTR